MKRFLSLTLAFALVLGLCCPAGAAQNPFSDVGSYDYYYDAVMWAYESGVTTGATATEFEPYGYCTRGQVATFLWRAAREPEPSSAKNPFVDVKSSDYFYKAVLWAVEQGITTGTTTTTFSPYDPCTDAQVVTFLWRAAGKPYASASGTKAEEFSDSDYFKTAVAWGDRKDMFKYWDRFYSTTRAFRKDIVYEIYLVRDEIPKSSGLYAVDPSPSPSVSPSPSPSPSTENSIVSVDAATIPTPAEGKATAYIDGVEYAMKAVKAGSLSSPTMELYFDDGTSSVYLKPMIQVSLGFEVNDEKGETIGKQYSIWYWDLWKLADEEEIGVSRYGTSSYGTLKAEPYDPSGETASVFELCMTAEDTDGEIHEIVIKANCAVSGLVSQYDPSTGGSTGSTGSFTPIGSTTCSACHGRKLCTAGCKNGRVYYPTYGTDMPGWTLCPICHGTGTCTKCGGSGKGN